MVDMILSIASQFEEQYVKYPQNNKLNIMESDIMAVFMECFDLDFLTETEEETLAFLSYVLKEGKPLMGYTGGLYIGLNCGESEFITRNTIDSDNDAIVFEGFDTHSAGKAVWTVRIGEAVLMADEDDNALMQRRIVVKDKDTGRGMAVVNVVNADVLPSYLTDDIITLQMVAFAEDIDYFADEDEYADSVQEGKNGKKMLLSDGFIFPSGLLINRNPDSEDYGKNNWMDDRVLIKGTVKKFYHGKTHIGDIDCNDYVICVIDTSFGELEIVHSVNQVKPEQLGNMREGAVVFGVFVLSGDAAIYEYENGIVKDEEHHLQLLRHVFTKSEHQRLNMILADDIEYSSDHSQDIWYGKQAVMEQFKNVMDVKRPRFAHMATISEVRNDSDDELPYAAGKRCVVLAYDEPDKYDSICFIDLNEDNNISSITFSTDSRYYFRLDEKFTPADIDIPVPDNFYEPMLARAIWLGFIDEETEYETVLEGAKRKDALSNLAKAITLNYPCFCDEQTFDTVKTEKNLFGYVFVYSAELAKDKDFMYNNAKASKPCLFKDAVNGVVDEKYRELFEKARGFYNDYALYVNSRDLTDEEIEQTMMDCLEFTMLLGQLYTQMHTEEYDQVEESTDKAEEYYFHDVSEFLTYIQINKDKYGNSSSVDTIWNSPDKYIAQYWKGYEQFEKGNYAQAITEYTKCFALNPIAIQARFEICESYIGLRMFDRAMDTLIELSGLIAMKKDAARLYRRFAFIAVEGKEYNLAMACLKHSLTFEYSETAINEEKYIKQLTKRKYIFLNVTKELQSHSIPIININ